jgi:hypothetical protein
MVFLMISYIDFVTKYPQYGVLPYTQIIITDWLEIIEILFPSIYSCLPERAWLLANRYALEHNNLMEDCDYLGNVKEYSSRNDTASYVSAGKTFSLRSTLPGRNLFTLFQTYGCYHGQGSLDKVKCGDCC